MSGERTRNPNTPIINFTAGPAGRQDFLLAGDSLLLERIRWNCRPPEKHKAHRNFTSGTMHQPSKLGKREDGALGKEEMLTTPSNDSTYYF